MTTETPDQVASRIVRQAEQSKHDLSVITRNALLDDLDWDATEAIYLFIAGLMTKHALAVALWNLVKEAEVQLNDLEEKYR